MAQRPAPDPAPLPVTRESRQAFPGTKPSPTPPIVPKALGSLSGDLGELLLKHKKAFCAAKTWENFIWTI